MAMIDTRSLRQRAAAAARALSDGRLDWDDFVAEFGDVDDPRVVELVDLIEHEPEVGGLSGVTPLQYRRYRDAIERLIVALEAGG
jgi:hypothetical protein